ncbi:MAG TPA: PQQ-binding-like beta-propeller repeat protein [Ktedonobacteraceae bacterium]|jgi:outer membrane protein assembly factor BamB/tRNA A-37 threonylcarbamoyl transferase component Bud32
MESRVGQQFGNYRLLRLLGHGGFADVYLGEHIYIGTQAAIKLLHTQLGEKETERFRQEASMVARLEHPHIVRVLDFGVSGTIPFLVMSYAPNGTLRERYPRGVSLPLPTIVSYVRQVADALNYAHNERIIHRDIKPENMLLGKRHEVLLSDFGIALISQHSQSQSLKDLAGTAAYMAPEQIDAHPRPASDQYALGIIVYEWLSGSYPFTGTFTEIALKHATVPPPPLSRKVPGIAPALEEAVLTALAKDPARRFASVRAFAQALEAAAATVPAGGHIEDPTISLKERRAAPVVVRPAGASNTPVAFDSTPRAPGSTPPMQPGRGGATPFLGLDAAPQPGDTPAPQPRSRFSPRMLVLLAALVVLLVGAGVLTTLRLWPRPVPPSLTPVQALASAVVRMQNGQRQAVAAYNQAVATNGSMFGLDAQHTRFNPYETILNLVRVPRVTRTWRALARNPIYFSTAVVADGLLYIGATDGYLYAFDALTGQLQWNALAGNFLHSSPAVANGLVYVGSRDYKLYAFDARTGREVWVAPTGGIIYSSPTVVDGTVYIGSYDQKLYAFDARSGTRQWVAPVKGVISYTSPAVANGLVYIGSNAGRLYAFDIRNGKQQWAASTGGVIFSSPAVANGLVYVGSNDGQLYAFDARSGTRRWASPTRGEVYSSPAVANGLVYVGSRDHDLYAFNASTGHQVWMAATGNVIESSPMVADGLVYIGSWDHKLYAFDAASGQQIWTVLARDRIYSSPLIANGVIYIGVANGEVLAFSLAH